MTRGVRRTSFGERRWVWFLVLPLIFARPGSANELFLKAESFLQSPNSPQSIYIFNGTIDKSKYPTEFERLSEIVVKGGDLNETATAEQLTPQQEYSVLNIESGDVGTYAIGVSTTTRVIEFSPKEFAAYLEAEKLVDDLAEFTSQSRSETVRERYTKYSKAIMQTGEQRSDAYRDRFGHSLEIIPQQNPYDLRFGGNFAFQVLLNGAPVPDQVVRAGSENFHGHDASGEHLKFHTLRTDANGRANVLISQKGVWYLSLIHLQAIDDEAADYESHWATLTFKIE